MIALIILALLLFAAILAWVYVIITLIYDDIDKKPIKIIKKRKELVNGK